MNPTQKHITRSKRLMLILTALLANIAMLMGGLIINMKPAYAATTPLQKPSHDYYIEQNIDGLPYYLGVIARDSQGRNAYCIETGVHEEMQYTGANPLGDTPDVRKIAYLSGKYQNTADPITHAAIASLIKDRFEARDKGLWEHRKAAFFAQHPDIPTRMTQLWDEAEAATVQNVKLENQYTNAIRAGKVSVTVTNSAGKPLEGVKVTLTIKGNAAFASDNKQKATITSAAQPVTLPWNATGDGTVTVSARVHLDNMSRLDSRQDYLMVNTGMDANLADSTFKVKNSVDLQITSVAQPHVLRAGECPQDTVTIKSIGEAMPGDMNIDARGYYFDSLTAADLKKPVTPDKGLSAKEYLAQLAKLGYKPAAYGYASFDSDHMTRTVQAVTSEHGRTPYTVKQDTGFGTWIWVIEVSQQDKSANTRLKYDVLSDFLDVNETVATKNKVEVSSEAVKHDVTVGSEIADRITVNGYQKDHAQFKGSKDYKFDADNETAQVSVYWYADGVKPSATVPANDAQHELVGTWEYKAVNGQFTVGDGQPDASGNPVHITAKKTGNYVFVYQFKGDTRTEAVTSAYNDPKETVHVANQIKAIAVQSKLARTGVGIGVILLLAVIIMGVGLVVMFATRRHEDHAILEESN